MLDLTVEFFSLGLNTLDSARENEILLQLYQSCKQGRIYRYGEFFCLQEVSLSLSG